jgi:hypothetical protein
MYNINNKNIVVNNKPSEKIIIKDTQRENYGWDLSWPYTNDPLLNPYSPPLSDERLNVSTTNYRQMGILTPFNESSTDKILQLMGRPLFVKRDKWQYYTISNQHNNVKLPIIFKKKNGLNDYGVDQIYTGDVVYVEGYNQSFKATIYENDTIRYLSNY